MGKKKSIGLPGGPNEFLQDITQYISVEGFKSYSPDKNNPVNIIESGSITMQDVDFPVLGTDNLGNSQMMFPENDYQFPGDMVFEIPIAQEGDETVQTEFEIDDRTGKINTRKGYDESKLFEFIKDKYKKVDTSTQKNDLVNKLSSPAFRERYKKNIFNITGENLSDEELTSRINSQVDFTAAGPDFNIKMPFVTHSSNEGYMRGTTPFITAFGDKQDLRFGSYKGLYQDNTIDEQEALRKEYQQHLGSNPKPLALDFPEFSQYPYIIQLGDKRESGIMGDRDVLPFDTEDSTIVHEYAHSYNTKNAPLFKPEGKNYSKWDRDTYEDVPGGQYKNWLSNLFGEDYFTKEGQPYGSWAMKPWEISSIRAENEQHLKNANIWDNTKGEFDESNLNKMLKSRSFNPDGAENMHLDKLGYNELERINYNKKKLNRKQEEFNSVIDGRRGSSNTDYIINNIINPENKPAMDMDTFSTIFNSSQNDLKDKQKYSDYNSLLEDYNGTNKRKKKRATEVLDVIYSGVKNKLNKEYTEEKEKIQNTFDEKKKEVLPKMKMYFNEIAMENPNEPVMAQDGGSIDTQTFLQKITNPLRKRVAENLDTYNYTNPLKRLSNAVIFNKKDPERFDADDDKYGPFWWADKDDASGSTTERMDLLNMTMGQPQEYNSIEKAIYKPTKSKDPDAEYYRSIVTENKIKQLIKDKNANSIISQFKSPFAADGYTFAGGVLGEYKISEGEDEKGKYISYYDKWDLNPLDHLYGNKKINKLVDKATKAVGVTPPEIYGRVYLNDLEEEETVGVKIAKQREKKIKKEEAELAKQFLQEYGFSYEQYLADPSIADQKNLRQILLEIQDGGSITPELLMKQAYVESNWDPNIVNSKGYTGLGQIGPQLAQDYKKANNIKGDINLLDPKVNADIQEWSMNELMNSSFINKGNSTDEVKLAKALAAYNWGRGNMFKMLVKQKDAGVDIYRSLDWLSELPKETLEYYKMITTDNFNPETRPLMQQDYLKALENDSIIKNYYKKSGGEYSVFKDYINGKYNNTKHENHAEKIYDKLNRIHYREAKEAGMSPANFIMTNISRYS